MWNIRKQFILFAVLTIILSSFAFADTISKDICLNGACIKAEVMETESGRQNGLMFRKYLAEEAGMLFVFDQEGIYSFWMKNMLFPIDIIWISQGKKVSFIVNNALPCSDSCQSLVPGGKAKYVLEVNLGFVKKHNIKIGDRVEF